MNFLCPHVWFATKNPVFQRLWGCIEVFRGRKLGLKKGKLFMDLLTEMNKTIAEAKAIEALVPKAEKVEKALNKLGEVAMHMGMTAMSENVLHSFAMAHPFLDVCLGWIELWRAVVSQPMIKIAKKKEVTFYQGQVKTVDFFLHSMVDPFIILVVRECLVMLYSHHAID